MKTAKAPPISGSLWIVLLSLALVAPGAVFAGPDKETGDERPLAAPERQEGSVVFYGNMTGIEPVMDAFSRKSDIKGIYTRISSSKFLSTVLAGMSAGRIEADVLQAPLLDPGLKTGEEVEWQVSAYTPFDPPLNWFSYVYPGTWIKGNLLYGALPLISLPTPVDVLYATLPVGRYFFIFSVQKPDGASDAPFHMMDMVEVEVK